MNATPTLTSAEHHDFLADTARTNANTYRAYLTWSEDPAQRRWAVQMAYAADVEADAEAEFAAALREVSA